MYYLNFFIIFSILGFILESTVYKYNNSPLHSGVLMGPYTLVYGFGGMTTMFIYNYFNTLSINTYLRLLILFMIFSIVCTTIEYLIGNLIYIIFRIDKWNYQDHHYHYGKYICLDLAITWGILSLAVIELGKNYLTNLNYLIPATGTYVILAIIIIDIIYTLFYKQKKRFKF